MKLKLCIPYFDDLRMCLRNVDKFKRLECAKRSHFCLKISVHR